MSLRAQCEQNFLYRETGLQRERATNYLLDVKRIARLHEQNDGRHKRFPWVDHEGITETHHCLFCARGF